MYTHKKVRLLLEIFTYKGLDNYSEFWKQAVNDEQGDTNICLMLVMQSMAQPWKSCARCTQIQYEKLATNGAWLLLMRGTGLKVVRIQ